MRPIQYIQTVAIMSAALLTFKMAHAQDSIWSLNRCIAHAHAHNLKIDGKLLDERRATLQAELSKWALLPNVSLNSNYGRSYGRSINPTTNEFENRSYGYAGLNGSASVLLFGWFQKRSTITKNVLLKQATSQDLRQLQNDISLNVATAYLRSLLTQEQVRISLEKLNLSASQVGYTKQLLAAGRSNGQDMAQVQTQLRQDSSGYFKAVLDYQLSVVDLKAILNISFADAFGLAPFTKELSLDNLYLDPEQVYVVAERNSGKLHSSIINQKAASITLKIARANLLPQLSISGFTGSNYSSSFFQYLPGGATERMPWGKQLVNNIAYSFSLNLNIPLFNGLTGRYAVKQAQLEYQSTRIQDEEIKVQLKNDVYKTCLEARTAFQTFQAAKSSEDFAQTAYEFAAQRYEKGLIPAMDLLIAQNQASNAAAEVSATKYDLLFKLLLIDYYLGKSNW